MLQLPNTRMMLYPPQHNPVLQCVCGCLGPHHHAILQGRACARWLISTEDTCLLFFFSVLCVSPPSLLAPHECILFTILSFGLRPSFLLYSCLDVLYTIQASILSHPGLCPTCWNKHWRPHRRALHGWRSCLEIMGPGSLVEWMSSSLMLLQPC